MRALTWLVFATAAGSSIGTVACLKSTAFVCGGNDSACGAGGMCEPEGFCSVATSTSECPSGRKFSDTAGDGLAGECVGGGPPPDGPDIDPDGPDPDGPPPDGPQVVCAVDYVAITDGNPNHRYKEITAADTWINQQNVACTQSGGYVAIPDDAAEMAAIFLKGGSVKIWLGVSDRADENANVDTLMQPYASLPITNDGNNQDCATNDDGAASLRYEDCDGGGQLQLPTVCECNEP